MSRAHGTARPVDQYHSGRALIMSTFMTILITTVVTSPVLGISHHDLPGVHKKSCAGLTNCLDYALNVIKTSDRYSLFESLWFDSNNGTNHSYVITTSDPKNFTGLMRKAAQVFDTHYLVWRIAPGLNVKVFKKDEDTFNMAVTRDLFPKQDSRTFGIGKRRIMMALLPIMYKLGVITTLLVALTVITLKGLTIGVILLMLSFGGIVSKLKGGHFDHGLRKDVHIHLHTGGKPEHFHHYGGHGGFHHGYSDWDREDGGLPEDTPTTTNATPAWSYLPPFISY